MLPLMLPVVVEPVLAVLIVLDMTQHPSRIIFGGHSLFRNNYVATLEYKLIYGNDWRRYSGY
jgi:hypothetical protein